MLLQQLTSSYYKLLKIVWADGQCSVWSPV